MGFYSDHIVPSLVSCACGMKAIRREREQIVHEAEGRVLEIGFGSGLNAPFYDRGKITHLYALEPSAPMRRRALKRIADLPFALEWLDLPGEEIPLSDDSVDSVLVTYTLCTIPDVEAALAGMRRVLSVFRAWSVARRRRRQMAKPAQWRLGENWRGVQPQPRTGFTDW